MQFFLEILTCDLNMYTMDHSNFTVSNLMGNSIGSKRVKGSIMLFLPDDLDNVLMKGEQFN